MQKNLALLFLLICLLLPISGTFAQDADKKADKSTGEDKAGQETASSLSIYHAKERTNKLREQNKQDIHRLRVVVGNYPDDGAQEEFDKILADYKEGVKLAYKSEYIASDKALHANHTAIVNLFAKVAEKYTQRVNEILSKAADALVDAEISNIKETQSPVNERTISRFRMSLQVAYGQLRDAETARKAGRPAASIASYRLAVFHGVHLLTEMASNEDEKSKLKTDYARELADVENQIFESKK